MKVKILGTSYSISYKSPTEDPLLKECDGYCDESSKKIVVTTQNGNLDDFKKYQKKCLRHEIIHAFLFESGLAENWGKAFNSYQHERRLHYWCRQR